jgi:hypothetical protein
MANANAGVSFAILLIAASCFYLMSFVLFPIWAAVYAARRNQTLLAVVSFGSIFFSLGLPVALFVWLYCRSQSRSMRWGPQTSSVIVATYSHDSPVVGSVTSRKQVRTEELAAGPVTEFQRPVGLTVLAAYLALYTVLTFVVLLTLIAKDQELTVLTNRENLVSVVSAIVLGAAYLIVANGYWQLKPWAWPLGLVIQSLNLVLIAVQVMQGTQLKDVLFGLVVNGGAILYLLRPEVRRAFGR